jgi:predicted phosphodiesterase
MRIAIVADIHGNLVALDAALAAIGRDQPDQLVCLGDVAATGPQPSEVLDRLRALGCPVVMGNADAWLLKPRQSDTTDEDIRRIEEIDQWCAGQLRPDQLEYLRGFEPLLTLPLSDTASLLCFHGSPRSFDEIILATTPDQELEQMLAGYRATIMAGGHTHTQVLRRFGETLVVNPGSVGLPFERIDAGARTRNPPWAEYAIVSCSGGELGVELRRVSFDARIVVRAAMQSGMPHAEWWAREWLA